MTPPIPCPGFAERWAVWGRGKFAVSAFEFAEIANELS
jgi:hypothetical protein